MKQNQMILLTTLNSNQKTTNFPHFAEIAIAVDVGKYAYWRLIRSRVERVRNHKIEIPETIYIN